LLLCPRNGMRQAISDRKSTAFFSWLQLSDQLMRLAYCNNVYSLITQWRKLHNLLVQSRISADWSANRSADPSANLSADRSADEAGILGHAVEGRSTVSHEYTGRPHFSEKQVFHHLSIFKKGNKENQKLCEWKPDINPNFTPWMRTAPSESGYPITRYVKQR